VNCESTNSYLTNCILTGNVCVGNGSAYGGAGVYQGTLNNCILSNNLVPVTPWNYAVHGGGAYQSILNYCLIISNSASFGGGAANSILNHCTVMENIAPFYGSTSWGGGTYLCNANDCLIAGNYSATAGGGDCNGILNYCVLSNNVCAPPGPGNGLGGGSYQQNGSYAPMLNNCLVISNYCYGNGGGVYVVGSILTNCTIVGNTATNEGGGVYAGTLKNSIIYGNRVTSVSLATSNIYNATLSNCWTSDPLFVNPAAADYHLQTNSPCINAGNNSYVSSTTDLDGNQRIIGGTVDIGAYEFQSPSSILSYAWAQQYGLPTDGTADYADSDGTGMNNWQKWIAGLNPTNPASVLKLTSLSNSLFGVTVTWQSVNTRTYYLQRSSNLSASPAFTSIQSNLVGQTGLTSYTDTNATNGGPYFYRIGVQ
jgi:parallel beta-helix repeat protein